MNQCHFFLLTGTDMDDAELFAIEENYKVITNEVIVTSQIVKYLKDTQVLKTGDQHEILLETNAKKRTMKLIDILTTKPTDRKPFQKFLQALQRNHQKPLATKIETSHNEFQRCSKRRVKCKNIAKLIFCFILVWIGIAVMALIFTSGLSPQDFPDVVREFILYGLFQYLYFTFYFIVHTVLSYAMGRCGKCLSYLLFILWIFLVCDFYLYHIMIDGKLFVYVTCLYLIPFIVLTIIYWLVSHKTKRIEQITKNYLHFSTVIVHTVMNFIYISFCFITFNNVIQAPDEMLTQFSYAKYFVSLILAGHYTITTIFLWKNIYVTRSGDTALKTFKLALCMWMVVLLYYYNAVTHNLSLHLDNDIHKYAYQYFIPTYVVIALVDTLGTHIIIHRKFTEIPSTIGKSVVHILQCYIIALDLFFTLALLGSSHILYGVIQEGDDTLILNFPFIKRFISFLAQIHAIYISMYIYHTVGRAHFTFRNINNSIRFCVKLSLLLFMYVILFNFYSFQFRYFKPTPITYKYLEVIYILILLIDASTEK